MPSWSESRVAHHASEEVAHVFNAAFEGYLVPMSFTPEGYERRMRAENLDPYASHLYRSEGQPAGVILAARRGWTTRIAGMAVAPAFRGQGLGGRMLQRAIEQARARADRRVILEVIETNEIAVRLYQKSGFAVKRRLVGFVREKSAGSTRPSGALTAIDPYQVAQLIAREEAVDWPWNVAPQTLGGLAPPCCGFALGDSGFAILSETETGTIRVHALYVRASTRGCGRGSELLHAVAAAYPGRSFSFSPHIPEGLADGWFLKNGWSPHPFTQFEMEAIL